MSTAYWILLAAFIVLLIAFVLGEVTKKLNRRGP